MAKPPEEVREGLLRLIDGMGLPSRLGDALFAPGNWHQSLSTRFPDAPGLSQVLARLASSIQVAPFMMRLDRLGATSGGGGKIHWRFRPASEPPGLRALVDAIQTVSQAEIAPTAHVTISYRAPGKLSTLRVAPVYWKIDEFLLVRGGGDPYHYEEIGRWPLAGRSVLPGGQLDLLDHH